MAASQATQTAEASAAMQEFDALPANERLSLHEMTRIMDVAATLRKERALVEQQLNIDELKAELRQRLLEAAKISGDPVSEAEVDAAVEQYYDRLHEFREPPASFAKFLAHCWVLRKYVAAAALALAAAVGVIWGLLVAGVLPGEARTRMLSEQEQVALQGQFEIAEQLGAAIKRISVDPAAIADAERLLAVATVASEQHDGQKLAAAIESLRALQAELELQYGLYIVNAPGEQSATERLWTDEKGTRTSGYFVFVDALDDQGRPVKVPIRNRETNGTETISRWGEQVPEKVFDRLRKDKQADGVLDERNFGKKPRGTREVEVELKGADGEPIERRGQITSWN